MPKATRFELPTITAGHNCDATTLLILPPEACPFTPTGLVIPDDVAPHFLITDIKVGKNSQLMSVGAVPASLFAKSAPRHNLAMDLADDRSAFVISATNISEKARNFRCSVEGISAIPASVGPEIPGPYLHVVGFGCTLVQGGCGYTTAHINVEPQIAIVPQWLHVPPHVLEHFEIDAVFVHYRLDSSSKRSSVPEHLLAKPQLGRSGAICLVPDPVAPLHQFITISVTNTDAQSRNFEAAILGTPFKADRD